MYISLNWISDFVDLPPDLDPRELAERFTVTTAETEGADPLRVAAKGLIAARIESVVALPATRNLRLVVLAVDQDKTVETITAAPVIHEGAYVVYAPPGASVAGVGQIGSTTVAGKTSAGMILPGDAIGIAMAADEAIFIGDARRPGEPLPPELFDDWLIEIDNKSITNRPDLWGHYGIAREIAAMYGVPLKPYPVVALEELISGGLPQVPIVIEDPVACPRYSAIVLEGVPTQPAPLWMQLRLGHIGMRPISGLVDLTNYIMADLGQPMHAFDAGKVNRIEVAWAQEGERFRTLDGMDRALTARELMIQCEGKSIALAGVMGGLETEVSDATVSLLLESANFDAATIRRTATRLGLRTDASARFEKSLDPTNTVLAIRRFIKLARSMYPELRITSRLSDGFPLPPAPVAVSVKPTHVARTIGRKVPLDEAARVLAPLGFECAAHDSRWNVRVPSFRATGDVSIEADVIEEIARCVGYGTIEPQLPRVSMRRFEPNALHELEQRTLEYLAAAHGFNEIQGYLWYDQEWLRRLGADPGDCVQLRNPAAEGLHQLRRSLMPGVLAAVVKNRYYFSALRLIELGSVFEVDATQDREYRHVGLINARRGKKAEGEVYDGLKGAIEGWSWNRFARPVTFVQAAADPARPWEHARRTAAIVVGGMDIGRISLVDVALRRTMEEHLAAWAVAWAEMRLSGCPEIAHATEPLGVVPAYPLVEMDFSLVIPADTRYAAVAKNLAAFRHQLLKLLRYVGSYAGDAIGPGRRSLTVRAVVGDDTRTLVEEDAAAFRAAFEEYLVSCGYKIRG